MRLRLIIYFCTLLSFNARSDDSSCLSVALGITKTSSGVIAAASAEIITSKSDAESEAELLAKSLFKDTKEFNIKGVYKLESCVFNNNAYVALMINKESENIAEDLNKLLLDSFKRHPVLK